MTRDRLLVDDLANELRQYRHSDMTSEALAEHILAIPRIHSALSASPVQELVERLEEAPNELRRTARWLREHGRCAMADELESIAATLAKVRDQ